MSVDYRSLLEDALSTIQEMRSELEAVEQAQTEPIAIIGMGCRFPGNVHSPESFWQLLHRGVDTVTDIPPSRWDVETHYDPDPDTPGKMYVRSGSFLEGIDQFDPQFFGITPWEATSMDPQQRLLLEVCWEALEHTGVGADQLQNSQTGVFVGLFWDDYSALHLYADDPGQIDASRTLSNLRGLAAGRLSYVLGLHGPAMQLDTACSSSLLAVHLACQSLRNGECDLALVGGVDLNLSPERTIGLCRTRALAPDGRCKTFDASADGFGQGEGCGVVVLKRLSDAVRDSDNTLASIRGSAVNHDGPSNGLTAPNGQAQEALLRQALENAAVDPDQIQYVETHGTGTPLGDPIEVLALANVLGREREKPLLIGSVKTNIGHLSSAAAVTSLIKVVLSLQHKEIPPNLHFTEPNPHIPWQDIPFVVPTESTAWSEGEGERLAGISSFGMTGTNVHLIVEEAPVELSKIENRESIERPCHLLCLSAKSEAALQDLAKRYETFLASHAQASLADVCFTANTGRTHFDHRLSVLAPDLSTVREKLQTFQTEGETTEVLQGQVGQTAPKIAFLFTGQGSQYVNMGRQLYLTQPTFRQVLDRCDQILRPYLEHPLLSILYPDLNETKSLSPVHPERSSRTQNPTSPIDETAYTQPALFALEYALAELWRSWGVKPDVVIGHSIGEYVAACVAGVFSVEDGLKLIAERGRLMQALPRDGAMVSVLATEERIRSAIQTHAQKVSLAAINDRRSGVISGDHQAVETIVEELEAEGIKTKRLNVSHAFHSPLMEPMLSDFESVARQVTFAAPQIGLISNVTGERVTDAEVMGAEYWRRHVRETVRFADGMDTLEQLGIGVFVEIGPRPILLGLRRQGAAVTDPPSSIDWLPSLRPQQEDWRQMLESLATLYVRGVPVDWSAFDRDYVRRKVVLPTYPFQRRRYWIESTDWRTSGSRSNVANPHHPLLGQQVQSAATFKNREILFESHISPVFLEYLADHRVFERAIFPATAYLEMALAAGAVVCESDGWVVEEVSIQQALILSDEDRSAKTVQLLLSPCEAGYDWQIFSRTDVSSPPTLSLQEEVDSWTRHASGKIVTGSLPTPPSSSLHSELQDLRARCREAVDAESYYQQVWERGIDYGSDFRALDQLFRGEGEALGQVRLPEALLAEAGDYELHPVLLDACLQVAGVIVPDDSEDLYLPTGVERLSLWEHAGEGHANLWGHAKIRSQEADAESLEIDYDLFDEQGRRVAQLQGLSLRPVGRQALLGSRQQADWLYEISWHPSSRTGQSAYAEERGSWLILADRGGVGTGLASLLEQQGEHFDLVFPGGEISEVLETSEVSQERCINPSGPTEFQRLFQESPGETHPPYRGIVYLWGLDTTSASSSVPDTAQTLCSQVLHLVQALIQAGISTRLWLVTQGTVGEGLDSLQIQQAPLWGLGRTILWEHPELQCTCLDLAGSTDSEPAVEETTSALFEELWFSDSENQIALCQGERQVARLARHRATAGNPLQIRAEGSYLITGGLGGLGLQVARWLVAQGARHLVLSGRRGASTVEARQAVEELEQTGARVAVVKGDVSQPEAVAKMVEACRTQAPLRGIVHAAGLLDDGVLLNQSPERFETVMSPKVSGTWHLHNLTKDVSLDFFVCFSSIASMLGSGGQGNYAAANAFMDALAHHRHALGLPALSINWGGWAEVGLAAELMRQGPDSGPSASLGTGLDAIPPEQGVQVLGALMEQEATQVGVVPVDWAKFQQQLPEAREVPLLSKWLRQHTTSKQQPSELLHQLKTADPTTRQNLLVAYLQEQIVQSLGLDSSQRPEAHQSYTELGVDSLMSIQLSNQIKRELGIEIPVSKLLEDISIEQLAEDIDPLISGQTSPSEIEPVSRDRDIPLSQVQQRLWLYSQLNPDDRYYHVFVGLRLTGKLDVTILKQCLDEISSRHETLRTTFPLVNDAPVQAIAPPSQVDMPIVDWPRLPEEEQSDAIARCVQNERERFFDLANGPLWRVTLMRLGEEEHILLLCAHHIIMDAWSVGILIEELTTLYEAFVSSLPSPLPPLPIQYADFAHWQHHPLIQETLEAKRNYGKQWLTEEPPLFELHSDRPRPDAETFRSAMVEYQINPDLTRQLEELSQQTDTTLYTIMLSAFGILLHRYSDCEELVVASPFANRDHQTRSLIGCFFNNLMLRIDLRGNPSFRELLTRVQQVTLAAIANQDVPFEQWVQELQPERNLKHNPLFRVIINLLPDISGNRQLPGLTITPLPIYRDVMRLDLFLVIEEKKSPAGAFLQGVWLYKTDLFEADTIVQMSENFQRLLASIVANPEQSVTE